MEIKKIFAKFIRNILNIKSLIIKKSATALFSIYAIEPHQSLIIFRML